MGFIRWAYGLVFLSGMTGLVYQITWQKYISTLVGSHASSAAAVLALFFFFLSMGYAFWGRYASRVMKNQLLLYSALEFVIGIYALYSPQIFESIFYNLVGNSTAAEGAGSGLFYVLSLSAAFIALPTFLMGGTIPVLTQALSSSFQVGTRTHALIYGFNTIGAFFGCILAGFYMIESLGLDATLILAGNLNILIAIFGFVIVKKSQLDFRGPEAAQTSEPVTRMSFALLFISFCSGYYTFSLEKIVIRMANLSLGSSAYTYAIVVSAFIFAIGLGSLILTLNKKFERPAIFAFVQIGSLLSVIGLHQIISFWPEWVLRILTVFQSHPLNFNFYWGTVLFIFVVILFLPVGLIGANLPLLFGLLKNSGSLLSQTVGRLYMVNCLGATAGAVLGGYWIFLFFEADQAYRILVAVLYLATLVSMFVIFSGKTRLIYLSVATGAFLLHLTLPSWEVKSFVPGLYNHRSIPKTGTLENMIKGNKENNTLLFSRFDPNTLATVLEFKGFEKSRALYVNGKPDAATSGDHTVRAMAALFPMGLYPKSIDNAFIIGLGAGLSTAILSSLEEVKHVDVAEISEGVVQSLPYFEEFNYGLKDRMQKVNIEVGDAYRVLMTKGKYDLIICEPSNPWVSGVDKLFSKEFYEIGRRRLNQDGYYVQWFPVSGVDSFTLSTILKTFQSVFPHVMVFSPQGGALTLIGSQSEFKLDPAVTQKRFSEVKHIYEKFGFSSPFEIYLYQLLTPFQVEAIASRADVEHSLFAPILEYRASRAHFAEMGVGISDILLESVPIPVPETLAAGQFLYDQYQLDIPVESYKAVALKSNSGIFHQSIKVLKKAHDDFPSNPKLQEEFKAIADYLPWLDDKTEVKLKSNKKSYERSNEIQTLVTRFKVLIAIGFRPKLSKLANLVENECLADDCFVEKRIAAQGLARYSVALKIMDITPYEPTPEQMALVNHEWENIKATYRKIGAY